MAKSLRILVDISFPAESWALRARVEDIVRRNQCRSRAIQVLRLKFGHETIGEIGMITNRWPVQLCSPIVDLPGLQRVPYVFLGRSKTYDMGSCIAETEKCHSTLIA